MTVPEKALSKENMQEPLSPKSRTTGVSRLHAPAIVLFAFIYVCGFTWLFSKMM